MSESITHNVVARFKAARGGDFKHKVVGNDARFLWGHWNSWVTPMWKIEELPQKGKKKLRKWYLNMQIDGVDRWLGTSLVFFDADDIAQAAGIGSGDNYDAMVRKIEKALKAEEKRLKAAEGVDQDNLKKWESFLGFYPQTDDVFYLEVEPEGHDSFTAQGKDFTVDVSWREFKSYSPSSDFQQADPHYTYYAQSAPASARKLYKILRADPEALKNVDWNEFSAWLTKNKVPYKSHHSVWH